MRKGLHAFTLLEIMLVVTIIALLMSAAIYKLAGNVEVSRRVKVQADLQAYNTQLRLYQSLNGFYPTSEQGLQALVAAPSSDPKPSRWTQLMTDVTKDPWGQPYQYICPGRKNPNAYDLYSAGPDRTPDTADDDWGQ